MSQATPWRSIAPTLPLLVPTPAQPAGQVRRRLCRGQTEGSRRAVNNPRSAKPLLCLPKSSAARSLLSQRSSVLRHSARPAQGRRKGYSKHLSSCGCRRRTQEQPPKGRSA